MSTQSVPVVQGADMLVSWTWDFWTSFWIFWIVVVPVGLLVWMSAWVIRRYNRDLKAREELYKTEQKPPEHGAK